MRRTALARSLPTPPWSAGTPTPHEHGGDSGGCAGQRQEQAGEEHRVRPDLHADVERREQIVERRGELVARHFEVELEGVDPGALGQWRAPRRALAPAAPPGDGVRGHGGSPFSALTSALNSLPRSSGTGGSPFLRLRSPMSPTTTAMMIRMTPTMMAESH